MIQSPKRWHIFIVDLEPRIGSKPGKQRPCVVIQPNEFIEGGLTSVVVLPITSKITIEDAYPLRVRIPKGVCGINKDSDIMIDQILAWDLSFFKTDLGILPESIISKTKSAVREFLDL